jgi:hypothetical protein
VLGLGGIALLCIRTGSAWTLDIVIAQVSIGVLDSDAGSTAYVNIPQRVVAGRARAGRAASASRRTFSSNWRRVYYSSDAR